MAPGQSEPTPGGELELALLHALWDSPESALSARELHGRVAPTRGIVYTTMDKVLDRMVEKRLVSRRRVGRAWVYVARVESVPTHRAMARRLLERLRGAGPRPAAAALLGALEDISPEWLEALGEEIRERRRRNGGT